MSTLNGKLIVIEGGDGAGKSTQIEKLKELFGERLVLTREPGGTPYAEDVRELVLKHPEAKNADGKTMFMFMWGARAEHMNHLIIPSLEEGKVVVTDRFDSSTYAYNIHAQDAHELEEYFWQTRQMILGDQVPDLYIYLDVTPEVGQARLEGRQEEKNHFDDKDQQKVRAGFLAFLERVPHVVVDASRTPDEIFEDIRTELEKLCEV